MPRNFLFICKTGQGYGSFYQKRSTGLFTSTKLVVDSLNAAGLDCTLVEAVDNNYIDRLVTQYKPDIVIIEALWVVPEKFPILRKLHPNTEWFVHLHSNIPFLALEGISLEWLYRYRQEGIGIIVNCHRAYKALTGIRLYCHHLPNIYPTSHFRPRGLYEARGNGALFIGCFGAIRPLKNQLAQAMAAIEYARKTKRELKFFLNSTRVENQGEPIVKSIRGLFQNNPIAEMVEVPWLDHAEFLRLISSMDISMQVSLSETFNIVSADAVAMGVPIVVSPEVSWASSWNHADPASVDDMVNVMERVERYSILARWNQYLLEKHSNHALAKWIRWAE